MKTNKYYISSTHNIYEDDYNEGEGKEVNYYTLKAIVIAENAKEAIKKYFENTLYYSFSFEYAIIDEEDTNILFYSNLVDENNSEASEAEKEAWKKGNKKLYSDNARIEINMLNAIDLNN
jgi:hypothetical protein